MNENGTSSGVVLRFRDGRVVHGQLVEPFEPGHRTVEAMANDGDHLSVSLDELKAIFFLKDPKRRVLEIEYGVASGVEAPGAHARVVFRDGEIIHGRVVSYSMADGGFFLYPTSKDSNNERIFVVAGALTSLAIEG